jgi:hypothetical protein
MPIRKYKKRAMKKRVYKKRRNYRGLPRLLIPKADYSCRLKIASPLQITNITTGPTLGSIKFNLGQCLNNTAFTDLFDQYRINLVVVKFMPQNTQIVNKPYDDTTTPTTGGFIPKFVVCQDRDDATVPASYNEVKARQRSILVEATKPITIKMRPSRLIASYNTGATDFGFTVDTTRRWINTANQNMDHFGLKYALEPASPANAFSYNVEIYYYMSFKNRKE